MADLRPSRIVHVDLADGLPGLTGPPGDRLFVVYWWRGTPLGHDELALPAPPERALAQRIVQAIAPAVGDRLFAAGFEGLDTGGPRPEHGTIPDLEALRSLERPLGALDRRPTAALELRVSVVVCTRDRPEDLERCLGSIAALADRPHEVIVVDNAPHGPRTREVVARFSEVRYLPEPRPGLSAARNAGVRAATGEAIAFTDDDTEVHPEWLAHLAAPFADPEVMNVTGLVLPAALDSPAEVVFEEAMGGFGRGYRRMGYGPGFLDATRGIGAPVWRIGAGANMAIRASAFDRVGLFDERLGAGAAGCSEDSELWYRLLADGWSCRYQPTAVVFHHHRSEMGALRRQAHAYIRGHVAALFVQFARHGDMGNLRRAGVTLPAGFARAGARQLAKRAASRLGMTANPVTGVYTAEVSGYVRGLRYAPLALPGEGPRHKAPLRGFLGRNPFPHPLTEGFFYREKMRAVHRIAPDRPFREILEVGGGQSGLTRMLYPAAEVTNVDMDGRFATAPPNQDPLVRFVQGDATALPFADASFDAVTMFDVIEHIPDDAAAVAEALRVLRPGGFVLLSTPMAHWRYPFYRVLRPLCPPEGELFADWGHVRRGYSAADLERLFGAAPVATATFTNPVTELGHDLAFSRLPSRARRAACTAIAPLTWTGYWLHRPGWRGSEIAAAWSPAGR